MKEENCCHRKGFRMLKVDKKRYKIFVEILLWISFFNPQILGFHLNPVFDGISLFLDFLRISYIVLFVFKVFSRSVNKKTRYTY